MSQKAVGECYFSLMGEWLLSGGEGRGVEAFL